MSVKRQAEFAIRKRKVGEPMVLPATVVGGELGIFYTDFVLWNPEKTASRTLTALVDTGASYVQVPASILEELGIRRERMSRFRLADGSIREMSMGLTPIELEDDIASVYVVLVMKAVVFCWGRSPWKPLPWPLMPNAGFLYRRTCLCREPLNK